MKNVCSRFLPALLVLVLGQSIAIAQITFTFTGYSTGDGASSVITGDFNRDGLPDFATVSESNSQIFIFINHGDRSFTHSATYTVNGASGVLTADVNHDGKLDLVVETGATIQVLLGNGDGSFHLGQKLTLSKSFGPFDLGNIKGDGYPDLVSIGCDSTPSPCQVYYFKNNHGTLAHGVSIGPAPGGGPAVKIVDLNADGHLDVMYTTTVGLTTRFGNGKGGFTATYTVSLPGAFNFVVGKFNVATNAPDVIIDSPGPGPCDPFCERNINVYSNNGKGVLTRTQRFLANSGTFAVGDIDGDGKLDLITLFGSLDLNYVDYYPGHGNGTIQSNPINVAMPFTASSPVIRDLLLNGRHDILYVEAVPGDVTVLLNDNAPVICAPPSASAVHAKICSLSGDGHFTGSGNSPAGLLRLELWIDGVKNYETGDDQFDHKAQLSPGLHRVAVVAVDPSNATAEQVIYVVTH